jgi:hypothetical protein
MPNQTKMAVLIDSFEIFPASFRPTQMPIKNHSEPLCPILLPPLRNQDDKYKAESSWVILIPPWRKRVNLKFKTNNPHLCPLPPGEDTGEGSSDVKLTCVLAGEESRGFLPFAHREHFTRAGSTELNTIAPPLFPFISRKPLDRARR